MTEPEHGQIIPSTEPTESPLSRDLLYAARYYLGGRRGLLVLAGLAIPVGLASNWSWLVTAGIAPILISLLPCAAMCAVGLCASRLAGKSCAADAGAQETTAMPTDAAPTGQTVMSEASPDPVAGDLPSVGDAAPATNPQPRTFTERNSTDE